MLSLRRLPTLLLMFLALAASFAHAQPAVANKELASLLQDYREDQLKHAPELASSLGDRRYNDQLSDLSAREANAKLERGRGFLVRLATIDSATLSLSDKAAADKFQQTLIDEQRSATGKAWQMPIDPATGVQLQLASLAKHIPLETPKDFDDYIARLKKVPDHLRQATTDIQLGQEQGRVYPPSLVQVVLAQVNGVAAQKPEDSPFALPLRKIPAGFPAATKTRLHDEMLAAIVDDVLPAYARFGRFLDGLLRPVAP